MLFDIDLTKIIINKHTYGQQGTFNTKCILDDNNNFKILR